tara:strand:+ start:337 stop:660 length:324 start_codon:yes stop_codon:yes gene_type:complete
MADIKELKEFGNWLAGWVCSFGNSEFWDSWVSDEIVRLEILLERIERSYSVESLIVGEFGNLSVEDMQVCRKLIVPNDYFLNYDLGSWKNDKRYREVHDRVCDYLYS